jgi:dTDP-4-dehydrorhamnose 3,5-epimerase
MTSETYPHNSDSRYPQFLEAAHNPDSRGVHSKFFGKGPAKVALSEPYSISEVFVTTNHKDVVRGMHFQTPGQPKLIQAISGAVIGNLLCANPELPEFGTAIPYTLKEGDGRILVPGDWALGYRILEEDTRILYLAGADFVAGGDTGIDPFDEDLKLDWGVVENSERPFGKQDAILSEKDLTLPTFAEFAATVGH